MPGRDLRVLVTGSRTWRDLNMVMRVLDKALAEHATSVDGDDWTVTVVHGGALGADTAAHFWAETRKLLWGDHVDEERHYPDWDRYPRKAGFIRNTEMAKSGIDIAVAFLMPCEKPEHAGREPHPTHGTAHCVTELEKLGIPVTPHEPGTVT